MSDIRDLLEHRHDVAAAVLFGADLPGNLRTALYRVLGATLDQAEARGRRARQRSAERSAAIRAGIRKAAGALPMTRRRGLAGIVYYRILNRGPDFYGLRTLPDMATIRAELRAMAEERKCVVSMSEPPLSDGLALSNGGTTTAKGE